MARAPLLALAAAVLLAACVHAQDPDPNACKVADPNCSKCFTDASDFCEVCKTDTSGQWQFGDDGLCRAPNCLDKVELQCQSCSATNAQRCGTCFDTNVVDATGKCVAPTPTADCKSDPTKGCATCAAAPNQLKCATCATAGWTVDATGKCVAPAPTPDCLSNPALGCATCNPTNTQQCGTCATAGWTVDATGKCAAPAPTPDCLSNPALGCATCNPTNTQQCGTCATAGWSVDATGKCVAPPSPSADCKSDPAKGCATCAAAPNQLNCATCATAGWTVDATGKCVAPGPTPPPAPGQACPWYSYSWSKWSHRYYRHWDSSYSLCATCDAAGKCLTCKNPQSYVVDAATGRCRAATCTERDAQCASCSWWGTCAACKQAGWVVDWYSKKCVAPGAGTLPCTTSDPNCASCNWMNACYRCKAGWSKDAAGKCTVVVDTQKCRALVPNCVSCKTWDYARCRTCASGYSLNSYGQCAARSSYWGNWGSGWSSWTWGGNSNSNSAGYSWRG